MQRPANFIVPSSPPIHPANGDPRKPLGLPPRATPRSRTPRARPGYGLEALAAVALILALSAIASGGPHAASAWPAAGAAAGAASPALPLVFLESEGLTGGKALFAARGAGYTLYATPTGLVLQVVAGRARPGLPSSELYDDGDLRAPPARGHGPRSQRVNLFLEFEGASRGASVAGLGRLPARFHSYRGANPASWCADLAGFERLRYAGLYPGVDVEVYAVAGRLEYDVILAAGADLGQVVLRLEGATSVHVDAGGSLVAETPLGVLHQQISRAFRVTPDGEAQAVHCRFREKSAGRFTLEAPERDLADALVVDPGLVFATYLGGSLDDEGTAVAIDGDGAVYVTGYTSSLDFPATPGAFDTTFGGVADAFLAKLDPTGSTLVYATFLGGTDYDCGTEVVAAEGSKIHATGFTASPDFPVTADALDDTFGGGSAWRSDAYLVTLDAVTGQLLYSTYLGGSDDDLGMATATTATGEILVAGQTASADFPITPGAPDDTLSDADGFVAKFDSTGRALLYATYLGGFSDDTVFDVAAGPGGSAWVTGRTYSIDFPVILGSYDITYNGSHDIFLSQIDTNGLDLVYSTFVGGVRRDEGHALAVSDSGIVYATGVTRSPNFPVTAGAYDEDENGHYDVFALALDPEEHALIYSTYLGGETTDYARGLSLGADGSICVSGVTWSAQFPSTPGAFDTTFNGVVDGFLAKLDPSGSRLVYSTFLGGYLDDYAIEVVTDVSGIAHVAGSTRGGFPVTPGAYDESVNGGLDLFVVKLDPSSSCPASWSNYGSGWPGTNGIPSLTCVGDPVLCTTFALRLENSAGFPTQAVLLLGVTPGSLDTPWGGKLLLVPSIVLVLTLPVGMTDLPGEVPCGGEFCGVVFYLQLLEADPGASAGISASAGLEVRLGE
ncbi:MAG: SBBP repeat-containing protein [Planctomycetota bacterium]